MHLSTLLHQGAVGTPMSFARSFFFCRGVAYGWCVCLRHVYVHTRDFFFLSAFHKILLGGSAGDSEEVRGEGGAGGVLGTASLLVCTWSGFFPVFALGVLFPAPRLPVYCSRVPLCMTLPPSLGGFVYWYARVQYIVHHVRACRS